MPVIDPDGGFVLALLRAAAVGGLLSSFGTLVFAVVVAPRAFAAAPAGVTAPAWRALAGLCRLSLLVAFAAALVWLVAEAGWIADAPDLAASLRALPLVLSATFFGHAVALRLLALAIVFAVLGRRPTARRWRLATLLCGATVCLHAAHSHAMAIYGWPSLLLASQAIHLLAAGAWLGGLLPLLLVVRLTPPKTGATACRWFSPLGQWCIAGIVVSASWQFYCLIGGLTALTTTAHGLTAAAKMVLFGVLLGFAAINRYRLGPALLGPDPLSARRHLLHSLAWQTTAGVLVVIVAAILSGLQPAIDQSPAPQGEPLSGENNLALSGLSFHSSASAGGSPLRVMFGHTAA